VAQVRALVRESVLEKLLAGEVLKIRVMDPALAHPLIGQPVNVLEQQQPDHEAGQGGRLPEQGSGHATGVLRLPCRALETPADHQSR
jgi:hypothetical protein